MPPPKAEISETIRALYPNALLIPKVFLNGMGIPKNEPAIKPEFFEYFTDRRNSAGRFLEKEDDANLTSFIVSPRSKS